MLSKGGVSMLKKHKNIFGSLFMVALTVAIVSLPLISLLDYPGFPL